MGGIRIRIPAAGTRPAPHDEFTSDLEEEGPVRSVKPF